METKTTSGISQGDEPQNNQNKDSKEPFITTNFLEFGNLKNGNHSIAIIKTPDEKRGIVAATIHVEFSGEPKRPTYTARDREGNLLYAPTGKLWELKKSIKENALNLHQQARTYITAKAQEAIQKKGEPTVEHEVKAIGEKVVSEAKEFGSQATDIILGTDRGSELKNIRKHKVQKSTGRSR